MDEFGQELNLVVDAITQTKTKSDANYEHYKIPFNKGWKDNKFYQHFILQMKYSQILD
jgi:hypothetical protein